MRHFTNAVITDWSDSIQMYDWVPQISSTNNILVIGQDFILMKTDSSIQRI